MGSEGEKYSGVQRAHGARGEGGSRMLVSRLRPRALQRPPEVRIIDIEIEIDNIFTNIDAR